MPRIYNLILCIIITIYTVSMEGCAIPKSGVMIEPVGVTEQQITADTKECYRKSASNQNSSLTQQEQNRLNGIETCRFFEGGRGRSLSCDRYVLCFLDKNYQYIEYPTNWLPVSSCEQLRLYKAGGIEEQRLKYICSKPENQKCGVCQLER